MQIIIGALTTGLGAALRGDSVHIAIALLGGMSTILASYLARARFSNEPESSLLRAEALRQFLREVNTFIIDYGDDVRLALVGFSTAKSHIGRFQLGSRHDEPIRGYRTTFANLMGQSSAQSEKFEDMKNGSVADESISRPTAHRSQRAGGPRDPVSFA
ncbi:hypothetical protein EWM64_g1056 [Hericium alpestre]|uniref:SMODS and SLOG-associating 2TM effector domain-containing protein n=1 Tax=Hericium alpestre TaxID=135208 RepID=A0A4Z0A792_9AGAM|nr:hypothetical protein EWM64_g1056 [Hericium alpestre]